MPDLKAAATPNVNSWGLSDNAASGIAYITIIPAIVFLIVDPFKKSSYVRFHAWQSIFFFIAWAVINILVGLVQHIVPSAVFFTVTVLQLVGLAIFIVWLRVHWRLRRKADQTARHWRPGHPPSRAVTERLLPAWEEPVIRAVLCSQELPPLIAQVC
jgi:uncharacterized membrane protein